MARTDEALSHGDRPSKQPHQTGDRNKDAGVGGSQDNESNYGGSHSPKATKHVDKT